MAEPVMARRRRQTVPNRGPTLRDVALRAEVSTATVSRALTRPELVSEAVHGRVAAAMEALAYVPNAAARALSGRPMRLVGVVVAGLGDLPTVLCLESLARELAAHDAVLMLAVAGEGETAVIACVRQLLARGAEALVYLGGAVPVAPDRFAPGRIPAWGTFDEPQPHSAPAASGFDSASAWALAARQLRGLGHQRVCSVGLGGDRRVAAVRDAAAGAGVELLDDVPGGEGVADRLRHALQRWQALSQPPTAVLCGSDLLAVAVLEACAARQIPVPRQLSVIGFGDTPLARQSRPTLSSLRVPAREAGWTLARSLLAVLEHRTEPPPACAAKLVLRGSTGPRGD